MADSIKYKSTLNYKSWCLTEKHNLNIVMDGYAEPLPSSKKKAAQHTKMVGKEIFTFF